MKGKEKFVGEISVVPAWVLTPANGAIPALPNTSAWPSAPSGTTTGQESTRSLNALRAQSAERAGALRLPEVVIYEHIDFGGAEARTNLQWYFVGDWWNDKISSIIVVSGVWRFHEDWHYEGRYWDLGEGYYRWVEDAGIPNDVISSFQVISY
jgi:Beta/Gamma crystallin